ncbi:MAG: flagellar hook-associated protein FlgK [Alphaproteobacteria bacterium]|nr:flagellar hook-associated protein FlgK [Alphaproteobacteria bacterium]
MSISALDSALSGLRAAQSALSTISNNISNASTEGYTKKTAAQSTLVVAGVAQGVQMDAITRNVNQYLVKALFTQTSVSAQADVNQSYLSRIQDFNGSSDSVSALSNLIGSLQSAFSTLSSAPESTNDLNTVISSAQQVAQKFNDYSKLLTQLRNDSQTQITSDVTAANQQLKTIAALNLQIQQLDAAGQSTADLEDQRDQAVKTLSKYIQVSTYTTDNKRLVVLSKLGQPLVDNAAHQLVFQSSPLSPSSYYPGGGANGLYIDSATGTELTQSGIGGEIGGLFQLRDQTLPTYQAQLDETAQKLASRVSAEGLDLFVDQSGLVPSDTAPPAAPAYVGFSSQIRVNSAVVADPTLLRTGTNGATVAEGSNELINRVAEYAFGEYQEQDLTGTVDISGNLFSAPVNLTQINRIAGTTNLNSYSPDLTGASNVNAGDTFSLTLNGSTQNITINAGDTPGDLVANINAAFGSTVASLTGNGQLTLNATTDITFAPGTMSAAGIGELGFSYTTYPASDPSFSITVGTNNSPVTIPITSADTGASLVAKINANVPGVTASLGTGGVLQIVPTDGGGIQLQNVNGTPLTAIGATSVTNVAWSSFRTANLGPNADLSSGLTDSGSIVAYGAAMLGAQAQDAAAADDTATKESAYLTTLDTRNTNQSGVNIDQEMADLVRVQNAYSAAGQVVSATQKLFDALLNAFSG